MARLVEMVIESVRVHMLSNRHVVILKDTAGDRYLPIWIGAWEASAIAMRLQGLAAERPLTHDLFAAALERLGVRVVRVVISELADETYHARLHLDRDGVEVEVDSRPSDALALAVRAERRDLRGRGGARPGGARDRPGRGGDGRGRARRGAGIRGPERPRRRRPPIESSATRRPTRASTCSGTS